jgi:hypothetical protein
MLAVSRQNARRLVAASLAQHVLQGPLVVTLHAARPAASVVSCCCCAPVSTSSCCCCHVLPRPLLLLEVAWGLVHAVVAPFVGRVLLRVVVLVGLAKELLWELLPCRSRAEQLPAASTL